jgi:hypothetical protein
MHYHHPAVIAVLVIGIGVVLATHPPGGRSPQPVEATQIVSAAPAETPPNAATGTTVPPAMPAAHAMGASGEAPHAMMPFVTAELQPTPAACCSGYPRKLPL